VEFAFIVPMFFVLVFGVIEFGFAFNSNLELRSASREGARLAAVDNGCATNACPATTADQQRDALIAATRAKAAGLAKASLIKVSISCSASPCTSSMIGTDSVTVCLNYTLRSVTGLFAPVLDNVVLKSKAIMRLEQIPTFSPGTDAAGPGAASC
jgi:Flp pilus assembly protein TadG